MDTSLVTMDLSEMMTLVNSLGATPYQVAKGLDSAMSSTGFFVKEQVREAGLKGGKSLGWKPLRKMTQMLAGSGTKRKAFQFAKPKSALDLALMRKVKSGEMIGDIKITPTMYRAIRRRIQIVDRQTTGKGRRAAKVQFQQLTGGATVLSKKKDESGKWQYGEKERDPMAKLPNFVRYLRRGSFAAGEKADVIITFLEKGTKTGRILHKLVELAQKQQAGFSTPVTLKMRRMFAAFGILLNKNTSMLVDPARNWFEPVYNRLSQSGQIRAWFQDKFTNYINNHLPKPLRFVNELLRATA